ncbi:MAG: tRNA pseudouridine(13) synthase TruD [Candidatus Thorarchaeota archaeon]|nr:MAG: tRNA pseudouridine(13) synthase TruD [Candidatus Thorarchaeota archaeon]
MKDAHPVELQYGIELYSSDFPGVGGNLKERFEDFIVEEIPPTKEILKVEDWQSAGTDRVIQGARAKHIHFTVQKMGLSTFDVAAILASSLDIARGYVGYAGLKDKRALTTQRMSVPARATSSLAKLKLSRIDIRDLTYQRHQIDIGDLWGNRFRVALRNADATCAEISNSALELSEMPLLNYFGIQRFGVTRPQTHLVGKALVKKDFQDAIRIMLTATSEFESDELTEARKKLSEEMKPSETIIDTFPRELRYERDVLVHLMKREGDYDRAFSKVPPRIQTLFVHSFQSYLFNRFISERVRSGLPADQPEQGDFLIQLDRMHSGRDSWLYVTEKKLDERKEQVQSKEFGVAGSVPGFSTKSPPSIQTDMMEKILRQEGIELQDFYNPERKRLSSPGGLHLVSIRVPELEVVCHEDRFTFDFILPKGSYATVIMREIMKNHPINRV